MLSDRKHDSSLSRTSRLHQTTGRMATISRRKKIEEKSLKINVSIVQDSIFFMTDSSSGDPDIVKEAERNLLVVFRSWYHIVFVSEPIIKMNTKQTKKEPSKHLLS